MRQIFLCLIAAWVGGIGLYASGRVDLAPYFQYQRATLQEKLYLTTDRPYYEAGDTLWFRGTLVNADNNSYIVKTNYIYVELLNRSDQVVMRRKVLREGLCFHHNLPLDASLATGEYTLRAYTSWMRNFSSENFFSRKLTIVNRLAEAPEDLPVVHDYHVSFFPEGGTLLRGRDCRVAFKAVSSSGMPEEVDGVIRNAAGSTLLTFSSSHDGMGSFIFPASWMTEAGLVAECTSDVDGIVKSFTLPVPETGVALHDVLTADSLLHYRVVASDDYLSSDSLCLLLHSGARLVAVEQVAVGDSGVLPLLACRDGISHLVLTSPEGIGLSRRLLFYRHPLRRTHYTLDTEWKPRDARKPVILNLALNDAAGHPLRGDFCISVTDMGYVNCAYDSLRDNLETHLLMTSDLRGYVHRPAWYFSDLVPTDERLQGLDLLMLTHGWCRFKTDTLSQLPDREFTAPLEEKEWISGRLLYLKKADKNIAISVVDTTGNSYGTTRVADDGTFFVGDLNYPDGALLNLRVLSSGKHPKYVFDKPTFPDPCSEEPFSAHFSSYIAGHGETELMIGRDGMRTRLLDNIDVVNVRKSQAPKFRGIMTERCHHSDYLDANYDLYQYDVALDLINQLIENEWSLYLSPLDEAYNPDRASSAPVSNGWGQLETFVIADEVYDYEQAIGILSRLRSGDIERIEVIDHTQNILEPMTGKAAMAVIVKPGTKLIDGIADHRLTTHRTFGYTLPEYFYHPIYNTEQQLREAFEPDLRKTLYWEPSFQTDKAGKAVLGFFNSDHTGPRHILIEGVTFSGRPVRIEHIIR